MAWELDVLQGVAATASEIGSGVYNVLSSIPLSEFIVDSATLDALKQLSGIEISPIVNNLGEIIGYVGQTASAANGSTAVSDTFLSITKIAETVTQEMIDAAIPLVGGGTTADLEVGQEITKAGLDAAAGVGAAAGTGLGSTALATVAGPAIAVALGVPAGVALYNLAPEFWTNVSMRLQSAGKMIGDKVISWFKTDGTEYYDVETIDIIRQALLEQNYLSLNNVHTIPQDVELLLNFQEWGNEGFKSVATDFARIPTPYSSTVNWYYDIHTTGDTVAFSLLTSNNVCQIGFASTSSFTLTYQLVDSNFNPVGGINTYQSTSYTVDGKTVYFAPQTSITFQPSRYDEFTVPDFIGLMHAYPADYTSAGVSYYCLEDAAWIITYGNISNSDAPNPNELPQESNGDSQLISPISTTVTGPLRAPSTSPDYNPTDYYDPTPSDVPDSSDVPTPQVDPAPQPAPQPVPDPHPVPNPTNPSDPPPTNPDTPGNTDTGDSPAPPLIIPMAASAVSKVFNPTQEELDYLGQYLWSSVNITDILKLFQSPLDGIIGLFKLYVTPITGTYEPIKLGYLPTGVGAAVVTQQVVTVDCGEIIIPLVKQNATDYPPYTTVQIYLPFIGIEPLNGYDLVGGQLRCQYRVDCYTGACIAQLIVTRDNLTATLYEFSGNCAQQIPLTSGNFFQLAGNIISGAIAGSIHGGTVGAAIGAGSSLIHSNVEVGRSGNLSANAGMLGSRIPYIIITRAISADATNYSYFYGYPANKNVYLRNCRGYVRVKDIILHTSATEAEKSEIERLLKEGVYI